MDAADEFLLVAGFGGGDLSGRDRNFLKLPRAPCLPSTARNNCTSHAWRFPFLFRVRVVLSIMQIKNRRAWKLGFETGFSYAGKSLARVLLIRPPHGRLFFRRRGCKCYFSNFHTTMNFLYKRFHRRRFRNPAARVVLQAVISRWKLRWRNYNSFMHFPLVNNADSYAIMLSTYC